MKGSICKDGDAMSKKAGEIYRDRINAKPDIVLGLATGSTPEGLYAELIRMHKAGEISFEKVGSFNLDEYVGLTPDHDQSYRYFMNEKLFDHVNIDKANTQVPGGSAADLDAECKRYEESIRAAGGIDLQLLGIGSNGHIGFAEPGSPKDGRTAVVDLTASTIKDNSRLFASADEVPKQAVSMGIGSVMDTKEVVMVANGANKADAVAAALEGEPTTDCPASFLQAHPNVTFVLDEAAAGKLTKDYERA